MDGSFVHSPTFDAAVLRGLFQANVLALLLRERMISRELFTLPDPVKPV